MNHLTRLCYALFADNGRNQNETLIPPPPPPPRSVSKLTLAVALVPALVASPAPAQETCTAKDISMSRMLPAAGPVREDSPSGTITQYQLAGACNHTQDVPVCVQVMDTTECDPGTSCSPPGNVAATRGFVGGSSFQAAGPDVFCTWLPPGTANATLLVNPHNNNMRDDRQNRIIFMMFDPFRSLMIDITDDD